ncbi:MAG: HRDC domain-containing protein [Planctomycetota bacterium]
MLHSPEGAPAPTTLTGPCPKGPSCLVAGPPAATVSDSPPRNQPRSSAHPPLSTVHPSSPPSLPPPVLVEDEGAMRRLLAALEDAREVAVDSEADSFYRYRERVCLVQMTVGERDWLVDPLAPIDLAGLGRVFADRGCVKVFHDGEYDVLILGRDHGLRFRNLFDTRIAAAALGESAPGLGSVVQARFGVQLDKSQQRSNWSRRPLTPEQVRYAQLDTHYLIPLMHAMRAELTERGRVPIVEGECRRLEGMTAPAHAFDPDDFVRLKGARTLNPRQAQLLRELFILRDELASRRDVPPFKVLGNGMLVEIARHLPRSSRALEEIEGLSSKVVRRLGDELLDAARRARERGPLERMPRVPARDGTGDLDDAAYELHERLKAWRKGRGQAEGLDSSLVLNRRTLLHLAAARPGDRRALAATNGILAWQIEAFGDEILALIARFDEDLAAGRIEPTSRGRGRGRWGSRGEEGRDKD